MVEDDRALASALARGLVAEGFSVDIAHDGLDGLWRAREGSYRAIVLDLLLPRRNGYQVCADLRAEGNWTPILVLTAKDGEYDEAEALDTGADDYLTKPFSLVVLVARLHALMRRGGRVAAPALQSGDLVLDRATQRVTRAGESLELTPREFALLEALMAEPGVAHSRARLLDVVWGMDFAGDPGVLEVYVHYLRRKLDVAGQPSHVQTVRGVGYRVPASRAVPVAP